VYLSFAHKNTTNKATNTTNNKTIMIHSSSSSSATTKASFIMLATTTAMALMGDTAVNGVAVTSTEVQQVSNLNGQQQHRYDVLTPELVQRSYVAADVSNKAYGEEKDYSEYDDFAFYQDQLWPNQYVLAKKDGHCYLGFRGTTESL
jgi:hypothetical protein